MNKKNKISGKIINHNFSYIGEIYFDENIIDIKKNISDNFENIIVPGFVDLHCHGGNGYDIMEDGTQVLEVKNGPYVGAEADRKRF